MKRLTPGSKLDPNASPEEAAISRARDDADGRYWSPREKGEMISGRVLGIETQPARKGFKRREVIQVETESGIKLVGVSAVLARKIDDLSKSKNPAIPPVRKGVGIVVIFNGLQGGVKPGTKIKGRNPAKLFGLSTYK